MKENDPVEYLDCNFPGQQRDVVLTFRPAPLTLICPLPLWPRLPVEPVLSSAALLVVIQPGMEQQLHHVTVPHTEQLVTSTEPAPVLVCCIAVRRSQGKQKLATLSALVVADKDILQLSKISRSTLRVWYVLA